mmetsp:Transcript_22259/g.46893  ORF Transcript_22259/g.46893 Transcript_22259/m.46893 type:complete len:493 (-) Transcript_22259:3099-4577(-)
MNDTKTQKGALVKCDESNPTHEHLKARPVVWGVVAITQTLLTSGLIFGWASLLPIIRKSETNYTPEQYSLIFTAGAIGNYTSTLVFGIIMDNVGPRFTGVIASTSLVIGLILCSFDENYGSFTIGFYVIGFAGPGIQMPTLHLANLFPSKTGGTGAFYMSAQAAAFDGGTAVFAVYRMIYEWTSLSASTFFLLYTAIPFWCLFTAIFAWPNEILETPSHPENPRKSDNIEEHIGIGSPYLSPKGRLSTRDEDNAHNSLINAPISTIVKHPSFWALASCAGIHILKFNFFVVTINDQLDHDVSTKTSNHLIDILGAMLPFGFVALPLVASILDREPVVALELVNSIGILYGAVLTFAPGSLWMQYGIVFPSVACSLQLVYSTLFHQVGDSFGFASYGVSLGLINVTVSAFSAVQTPFAKLAENQESYYWANLLWAATFPFFFTVLFCNPEGFPTKIGRGGGSHRLTNERTRLLADNNDSRDLNKRKSTGNLIL